MIEACRTCIDLLNGALSLTARGRTLYGSQHRADTLALPNDAEGWQVSGLFDQLVKDCNRTCHPGLQNRNASSRAKEWAESQFQHGLRDREARARKHMLKGHR
jgi:hypothetical protein